MVITLRSRVAYSYRGGGRKEQIAELEAIVGLSGEEFPFLLDLKVSEGVVVLFVDEAIYAFCFFKVNIGVGGLIFVCGDEGIFILFVVDLIINGVIINNSVLNLINCENFLQPFDSCNSSKINR